MRFNFALKKFLSWVSRSLASSSSQNVGVGKTFLLRSIETNLQITASKRQSRRFTHVTKMQNNHAPELHFPTTSTESLVQVKCDVVVKNQKLLLELLSVMLIFTGDVTVGRHFTSSLSRMLPKPAMRFELPPG